MVVVDSGVSASAFAVGVAYTHAAIVSIVRCTSPGHLWPSIVCAHCGGARGVAGDEGWCRVGRGSNQAVARSLHSAPASRASQIVASPSSGPRTPRKCCNHHPMCTYRYFLALRRSALAIRRRSTTCFPLRSAFHGADSPSRRVSEWVSANNTCSNRFGAGAARCAVGHWATRCRRDCEQDPGSRAAPAAPSARDPALTHGCFTLPQSFTRYHLEDP